MRAESINDFSGFAPEEIAEKWNATSASVAQRREDLNKELQVQKENDLIRKDFAAKATEFNQWLSGQKEQLAVNKKDLEEELAHARALRSSFENEGKDKLHHLEEINKNAESRAITKN